RAASIDCEPLSGSLERRNTEASPSGEACEYEVSGAKESAAYLLRNHCAAKGGKARTLHLYLGKCKGGGFPRQTGAGWCQLAARKSIFLSRGMADLKARCQSGHREVFEFGPNCDESGPGEDGRN